MATQQEHPEPTLRGELRRGFDRFNLGVGALTGIAAGAGAGSGIAPLLAEPWTQATVTALVVFSLITSLHVAVHGYFGWRFERGLRASRQGQHARAAALLAPAARKNLAHYDLGGHAARALLEARASLPSMS